LTDARRSQGPGGENKTQGFNAFNAIEVRQSFTNEAASPAQPTAQGWGEARFAGVWGGRCH